MPLRVKSVAEAKKWQERAKQPTVFNCEKRVKKLEHNQEQLQKRLDKMMAKLIADGLLRFIKPE